MLDPQEKAAFEGMVTHLRAGDPKFTRRVDRLGRPRLRLRLATAILLWTIAPVCVVFGGWTGVIMAVVATAYGTNLYLRRRGMAPQPTWWTTSRGRRPDLQS